jgi:hypothetical protein
LKKGELEFSNLIVPVPTMTKRKKISPNTSRDDDNEEPTMLDLYKLLKKQDTKLEKITKDNENLAARLLAIEEKLTAGQKEIEDLKRENLTIRKQVVTLQLDINEIKQEQLTNNLVISGAGALEKGLSAADNLNRIAEILDVSITNKDVSDVYTVKRKSGEQLVVKFVCAQAKLEFMNAMKMSRKTAKDSGAQFSLENTFFSDQLTQYYENLWFKCRALKKNSSLAHAWTKMGKLYLRKQEGGSTIRIHNIDDLSQVYTEYGLKI